MSPDDLTTFYEDARRSLASGDELTFQRRTDVIADACGMTAAQLRDGIVSSQDDAVRARELLDDLHARHALASFDPFAMQLPTIPERDDENDGVHSGARVDPAAVDLGSLFA